jgi:metal-responsive CopG/Arc/MetJ family transcriptional regulator
MRTTVEITEEQRARLLALAARRGEKGFSKLVQEALDRYLAGVDAREKEVRSALAVIGSFDDAEGAELEHETRSIRESWR